jgi:diacylglycerol kinase family enzyme
MSGNVASALGKRELQHWQVKQVNIQVDPPQTVQVDGDDLGVTPVEIHSLPGALKIIVPN